MAVPLAFLALLIEAAVGYPRRLTRFIGHPVVWIGSLIGGLERCLNRKNWRPAARRVAGVVTIFIVVGICGGAGFVIERGILLIPYGLALLAVIASSVLAQRSLYAHVAAVADALEHGGLESGRQAVAMIVGRDTTVLDEAGVSRAAIESLAENFSDGVVAPAFWLAAAGLAGGVGYKAINTADSMIGHRTPRYASFGWAAARLDDLVNLPASRLSALLILAGAGIMRGTSAREAWRAVLRDAPRHRSPNAGYPEAAMAGALGLALAGPRSYGGQMVDDALMGNGRRTATSADIRKALGLYRIADFLLVLLAGVVASIVIAIG